MSKYLYLFCAFRYVGVKYGLATHNLVRYTGVFVLTGFVISGFLPIQNYCNFVGPKKLLRYNGDFVISGFHCIQLTRKGRWFFFKTSLPVFQLLTRQVAHHLETLIKYYIDCD